MPRSLGSALPAALWPLFDGQDLRGKVGQTFLLLSGDSAGWPDVALLSAGEVLGLDSHNLRVALWLHSTATHNLERDGRALLVVVAQGAGFYLRLTGRRTEDLDLGSDGRLAVFDLRLEGVHEDRVDYAELTSGITFRLPDPDAVVGRWQTTIDALRQHV